MTIPLRSHSRRLLASLLAGSLLLVACGDDTDEDRADTDAVEEADDATVGDADDSDDEEETTAGDAEDDIEGLLVEDGQSNDHADGTVDYDADPPSGGEHNAVWLNCGVYEMAVPNENAVHSLEHGAVWFAYQPDLAADQVEALADLASTDSDRVIVSPYPDLPSPVIAVAWERRLEVDDATDPRLATFLDTFVDGEQSPEPGAPCSGGVG